MKYLFQPDGLGFACNINVPETLQITGSRSSSELYGKGVCEAGFPLSAPSIPPAVSHWLPFLRASFLSISMYWEVRWKYICCLPGDVSHLKAPTGERDWCYTGYRPTMHGYCLRPVFSYCQVHNLPAHPVPCSNSGLGLLLPTPWTSTWNRHTSSYRM